MNKTAKKIITVVSVVLNVFFLLLCAASVFVKKPLVIRLLDMNTNARAYTSAACIVSVPEGAADIDFGCPSFSLKKGEEAALQFSVYSNGQQMNVGVNALFDRDIIAAEPSGFGLVIRALAPGETVMQVFSSAGARDVARITVSE